MKKLIIATFALSLFAFSANAQIERNPKSGKEDRVRMQEGKKKGGMYSDLDLSETQKAEMQKISETYRTEMQSVRANNAISSDEKKDRIMKLRAEQKQKVEALLTPDQKVKLDKKREGMKEERMEKMEDKRDEKHEKMTKELNLSNDQGQKIKELHERYRNQMKAIKDNSSISQEERMAQVKSLKEKERIELKSILSAEQFEKYSEMRKDNRKDMQKKRGKGQQKSKGIQKRIS